MSGPIVYMKAIGPTEQTSNMKYVNFTLKEMTPEQMKIKPIKPIVKVNTNEVLDTEEGEPNSDEQKSTISYEEKEEFTTSEELTEDEYYIFSHMSNQDSESDINVDEPQHQENPHTPETLQNNTTLNDKIIQYMMNMIHQKMKIQLKLKQLKTMGRKFMKQKSQYL